MLITEVPFILTMIQYSIDRNFLHKLFLILAERPPLFNLGLGQPIVHEQHHHVLVAPLFAVDAHKLELISLDVVPDGDKGAVRKTRRVHWH